MAQPSVARKRHYIGGLLITGAIAGLTAVALFSSSSPLPPIQGAIVLTNETPSLSPLRIAIPSLGIEAPIIEPDGSDEESFQRALQHGVVHFPGTATAGAAGNAYYFAHSSDFLWTGGEYKTVFAHLPEIQQDARIYVSDASGIVFTYSVTKQFVVEPEDTSVLAQTATPTLTLQTSYPIGTAKQRYIVSAELVTNP